LGEVFQRFKKDMLKEKRNFVNGEIYHIVLRRIGKELLFKDIDDYYRGIFTCTNATTKIQWILDNVEKRVPDTKNN
jgi:hypothetical protein